LIIVSAVALVFFVPACIAVTAVYVAFFMFCFRPCRNSY
jgi:hypothetical protein